MSQPIQIGKCAKRNGFGKHLLLFPSMKTHDQVVCHSALEADYCTHLEHDPQIISYTSQPIEIPLTVAGKLIRYRPDFLIETADKIYYTEVKLDFRALGGRALGKLKAAQRWLTEQGSYLAYADEQSIRSPKLRNIKFLYFHSFNVGADELGCCMHWLSELSYPVTLQQLLANRASIRERAIYRMLFNGYLSFNFNDPLTLESCIRRSE